MSNRVDFYQAEETTLALAASKVLVFVEGELCSELAVKELVRGGPGEFSFAKLIYNPAGDAWGEVKPLEEVEREYAARKSVSIRQACGEVPNAGTIQGFSLFEGVIEGIETRLDSEGEHVEITARDFGATLERISVYGERVSEGDGATVLLGGAETGFNPDDEGNASKNQVENNGYCYTVFCAQPDKSKLWSCAEAIAYLLCEYLPKGVLGVPSTDRLKGLMGDRSLRDVNVTGMSLAGALGRICEQGGIEFRLVPFFVCSGPRQAIVFYKPGAGREVELNCQPAPGRFSISKTNIAKFRSNKSISTVTHKYIARGDFKVYEATFELVKAWDPADESTDYDEFSPSSNSEFVKVRDVYRKWCLNEAGDYSGEPYNQGEAFDFSKVFEGASYARRRRRFWPALSRDKNGKSLGYFLEVSLDSGQNWRQYLGAFNNLHGECGVWLSGDLLGVETWVAALKGALRFRMTASVVGDERLSCSIADGPVNSTAPVIEHMLTPGESYQYRKVSGKSIFVQMAGNTLSEPDEVDDTEALYEFVRGKAEANREVTETAEVQTPYLDYCFDVGDRVVTSPDSRDLLGVRRDNRSIWWIRRVRMDFENQQTELEIARRRK
jgi:hypothetical protein